MAHELEAKFIPNYTERSESKRTREVVDSTDWNELWNLNSTQGDHSEMWVDAIYKYLFGSSNFDTTTTAKIAAIDTYAQTLNTLKEDKSTANLLCATIEYVDSTGVFTFKDRRGNVMKTVDLNIEKIPASITLVKVGDVYYLRIINTDGSYTECPVSTLFNPVSFATDAQHAISFDVVTAADGSKTVKAQIKDGMVTDNMLNSEVMLAVTAAKIAAEAARDAAQAAQSAAETAEDNAHDSEVAAAASQVAAAGSATNANADALKAEGHAIGKQAGQDVPSTSPYYHNNAKYYKDLAESAAVGTVHFDVPQQLTEQQKEQARENIGASTGAVKYNEAQNLTASEKLQARTNIGAISQEQAVYINDEEPEDTNIKAWIDTSVGMVIDAGFVFGNVWDINLLSSGWTLSSGKYTQTVSALALDHHFVLLGWIDNPTDSQADAYALIEDIKSDSDGYVTVVCSSQPSVDLPIKVKYHESTNQHMLDGIIPRKTSVTLDADDWSGSDPYSQTITISGTSSDSKVDIQPSTTVLAQLIEDGVSAMYVENNNGTLTCYSLGEKPSTDITVQMTYSEVVS